MTTEVAGCKGKVAYPTRKAAELVAKKMKSRKVKFKVGMDVYRCMFCDQWHLGASMTLPVRK